MYKNDNSIQIIADDRERKSEVIASLLDLENVTIRIQ
jgi:hypothetical protein